MLPTLVLRVASDEINYRRFFDINDLAALNMEREDVFTASHGLILALLSDGHLDGVRIDHPDGLYDPQEYFRRLQQSYLLNLAQHIFQSAPQPEGISWQDIEEPLAKRIDAALENESTPLYVVAEKILGAGEPLPEEWSVHGTSGYDFINAVNGLFVDTAAEKALTRLYRDWVEDYTSFAEMVYRKKGLILQASLSSELHMLAHQLDRLAQKGRQSRDFTLNSLRDALREVIACFPVYRSYINAQGPHDTDRRYVEMAVRRAAARNPLMSRSLFRFVRDALLEWPATASEEERTEWQRFAGKFQQVTAPVMAKGAEDTAFYVYNRLVSLNEVGGDPGRFGMSPEALHRFNGERQAKWPYSLSPLATHDTKRSSDVRARLNVLSEVPDEWRDALHRWSGLNVPHRRPVGDATAPDANEEYLLYQTLLGAWPLEPYGPQEYADFVKRIQAYMVKTLHEAKVHSSWVNPNPDYDDAVQEFVARILDEEGNRPFLTDFGSFQRRLNHFGLLNSLAQTLLEVTCPGVADTFQGTEIWDLSLVDPDNRRPVDYQRRRHMLDELMSAVRSADDDLRSLARGLVEGEGRERAKLYVNWRALHCRRQQPGLFTAGEYRPLEATGSQASHVFAFARRSGTRWAIVVVPRLLTRLVPQGLLPLGRDVWQDTRLLLTGVDPGLRWHNLFTGARLTSVEGEGELGLPLADLFAHFPVALLIPF